MSHNSLYKFTSIALITLAILSYFFGFYFDENSAEAGSYKGDITNVYYSNLLN